MKNLGKKRVRIFSNSIETPNGPTLSRERVENRVVYQRSDGSYCINWLSGKRSTSPSNRQDAEYEINVTPKLIQKASPF